MWNVVEGCGVLWRAVECREPLWSVVEQCGRVGGGHKTHSNDRAGLQHGNSVPEPSSVVLDSLLPSN